MSNRKIEFLSKSIYLVSAFVLVSPSFAGPRERAFKIHQRIAGVPPSTAVLDAMEAQVAAGNVAAAAAEAMKNPFFYSVTLKSMFAPLTSKTEDTDIELNDFIATAIGLVRDDIPFNQALYGDVYFIAGSALNLNAEGYAVTAAIPGGEGLTDQGTFCNRINADATVNANCRSLRPSAVNNHQYRYIERKGLDLSNPGVLAFVTQSQTYQSSYLGISNRDRNNANVPAIAPAVSGLITTRGYNEFYTAGTNRGVWRYSLRNFMCLDMEQLHDTSLSDYRVRRDVDRRPGGDSRVYSNKCVGCHAVQDPFAGAFAYYDWQDINNEGLRLTYQTQRGPDGQQLSTPGNGVAWKYNDANRISFPSGYETKDDSWTNNILGSFSNESLIGWPADTARSGNGISSLFRELARTKAFSKCMAKRAFEKVCLRKASFLEKTQLNDVIAPAFEQNNYKMKDLFATVAGLCIKE